MNKFRKLTGAQLGADRSAIGYTFGMRGGHTVRGWIAPRDLLHGGALVHMGSRSMACERLRKFVMRRSGQ